MKINKKIPLFLITLILLISMPSQVFALTYFIGTSQTLDSAGDVGGEVSLAVVNGNPAISYYDVTNGNLKFICANNSSGTSWGTPQTLDSTGNVGGFTSLIIVNGNPAISYYDGTNGDLKFIRASNANGTSWGTPQTLDSTGNVGGYTSLRIVNGNPAVSYYDWTNGNLKFIRSTNVDGTAWGTSQTVDSSADVGMDSSMAVVNGVPAISYYDRTNRDLKFIRASNANGTAWNAPQTLDSNNSVGSNTSLAVVNGNPAISYVDSTNYNLKFICASDTSGIVWNTPQVLDSSITVVLETSLDIINGTPAISYFDDTNGNLKLIIATNANGTAWVTPLILDQSGNAGLENDLAVINGYPAVSYRDESNGDLKFICLSNTVDITLSNGAASINDGDTLDFGSTTLYTPITISLSINNNGSSALNLSNLSLPTGFSLTGNYPEAVASGSSEDIQIRLDALQAGTFSGSFQLGSNDTNQSPYIITLEGEVTESHGEIAVFEGTTEIVDGTGSFDYGSTTVGTPLSHTFTVKNSSTEDLNLYSLSLPTGFSLQGTYDNTVPAGDSTVITVRLDAISVGTFSGQFSLANDDVDENPFNFPISGEVLDTSGEIAVLDGLIDITDGETTPIDFGDTVIGTTISRTFTIQNLSVNDLDVYSLTLPYGFSLQGSYNHVVAPSGTTSITVQLDSQFVGAYSGEFSLSSDDTDENPFNFAISGNVLSADGEISVFDGATEITDGSGSVDYGSTPQGTPLSRTFTIRNSSTEVLDLYALTLPGGFSLQNSYDHTVDSGKSTSIVVQLDAQIVGSYSGEFSLSNDDADEAPFNFTISGEVINTALETGIIAPLNGSTVLDSRLQVAFNHDVLHDGSDEAADNPLNYLLVEDGRNGLFDTTTCLLGVAGDDVQQTITTVTYDDSTYIATITTDPLPAGRYQLLVCGTASIQDATGNVLNGGAFDSVTTFTVIAAETNNSALTDQLPATGFTPGTQTSLPTQPAELAYNEMDSLTLQIPSLKVNVPIVGVPQTSNGWDVTWLTNAQAGWLNGTAYPTWDGNTVLTGHVTNASGNPGPFANIKTLKFGDQITIQAYGETYTYEVRENKLVTRDNLNVIDEHKSRDWVTLITCETFNETTNEYLYRRVVQAVLVEVN